MGRKANERFVCSCGEACVMLPHERSGGLWPITVAAYDNGFVELVLDDQANVLWRIVPKAEREADPRPRLLYHWSNCPDAAGFRR